MQPIDELETALVGALDRGVKIEIVSARNRDQPAYKCLLNSDLFNKLSKRGAVIYEEPFKFLHMKAIVVDDGEQMTLGSFNQDAWSFYCNNEANLFLKRQQATETHKQFMRIFNGLKRESRLVDF